MKSKIFEIELVSALKIPSITDHKGQEYFDKIINRREGLDDVFSQADDLRMGEFSKQFKSAYYYYALAFKDLNINSNGKEISSSKLFHFAGHGLREIGQLKRAADAYWRAGIVSLRDNEIDSIKFGIRSLARAKVCYQEIGESELADEMHILEWNARKLLTKGKKKFLINLWQLLSVFGCNPWRWFAWLFGLLIFSSVFFEMMHKANWFGGTHQWIPVLSSFYFSIVTITTLGYGDIAPTNLISLIFTILYVIVGYFLLGIGITIIVRKMTR